MKLRPIFLLIMAWYACSGSIALSDPVPMQESPDQLHKPHIVLDRLKTCATMSAPVILGCMDTLIGLKVRVLLSKAADPALRGVGFLAYMLANDWYMRPFEYVLCRKLAQGNPDLDKQITSWYRNTIKIGAILCFALKDSIS